MTRRLALALPFALVAVACAPADVAGTYTVATTNGPNNCSASGWDAGATATGIPVVITQDGGTVQIIVEGLWGTALELGIGGRTFNGQVGGSHVTADLVGDVVSRQGECVFTYTLELDADLRGDLLEGNVTYRPVTNGHADCGILQTCQNVQAFNGTRPPSS